MALKKRKNKPGAGRPKQADRKRRTIYLLDAAWTELQGRAGSDDSAGKVIERLLGIHAS